MQLFLSVVENGFVISSIYALGAVGFTLIFGVSGVLNLAHGGTLVISALIGWFVSQQLGAGPYLGCIAGIIAGVLTAYITYFCVVRPLQNSRVIPTEDQEVFILTATMILGFMIELGMSYVFSNNPVSIDSLIPGVIHFLGTRMPSNNLLIVVCCWIVMASLWLMINRTRAGQAMLATSMNPKGVSLLGFELSRIFLLVWTIYGLLAGLAGVLIGTYIGTGTDKAIALTASAFSIVVLGGLGSVSGTLVAAFIVGYLETLTAYFVSPALRAIPALALLIIVVYTRPQGLMGRPQ